MKIKDKILVDFEAEKCWGYGHILTIDGYQDVTVYVPEPLTAFSYFDIVPPTPLEADRYFPNPSSTNYIILRFKLPSSEYLIEVRGYVTMLSQKSFKVKLFKKLYIA